MTRYLAAVPAATYMFDNASEQARRQLPLLGALLDPHSIQVWHNAGLATGWRVTELGAGGGTLTAEFAQRVGPTGHVTAVDLDTRHIVAADNVTIVADDIRTLTLPDNSQDGVNFRLVLMHTGDPEKVLARYVPALRPDRPMVVTDWECRRHGMVQRSPSRRATVLFNMFQDALLGIGEDNGADLTWATRIGEAMWDAGLVNVATFEETRSSAGGNGICMLHRSNSIQKQAELVKAGMTVEQLDELRTVLMDPALVVTGYRTHTAVGWRASASAN